MGDVDDLHDVFPVVDRGTIKRIYESVGPENAEPEYVARVLDRAANKGKVPDRDYREMARENGGMKLLEIDLEDPLDDPPERDPTSPANRARGEKALRWAEENAIGKRARRLAKQGSVEQLLEFLVVVDKWANEALLSPERSTFPESFDVAINTTMNGVQDALDEAAHNRDQQTLEAAKATVRRLHNEDLRRALEREIDALLSLLDGDGGDYEAARSYVLDEELTPIQMAQRADRIHHNFDLTVDQYEELLDEANEILDEVDAAIRAGEA